MKLPPTIDEESKKFIDWNFQQIKDDDTLIKLIDEVTNAARSWLFKN